MNNEENSECKISDCSDSSSNKSITVSSSVRILSVNRVKNNSYSELIMPPSPPKFVSMNQLTEAAESFYNMSLAHEITVDSDFKLEKYEHSDKSLEHQVKEIMHRAFWDILRSSLEADPPDYEPVFRLLDEVKQSLENLVLPHQSTLRKLIDNLLDLDVARSELEETGSLSLTYYIGQVIDLMKKFCAPVRDYEVEELRQCTDPIDAFRSAFILLEKMHMDLANFTIAQMRPYIRQQAVAYERTKFDNFLQAQQKLGFDGLASTRIWINEAFDYLSHNKAETGKTNLENNNRTEGGAFVPATPNNILREAYLAVLCWPPDRNWPETMVMDQKRLTDLGTQLKLVVNLTSLVLVICNYVASALSPPPSSSSTGVSVCPVEDSVVQLSSTSATSCPSTPSSSSSSLFSVCVRSTISSDAMIKLKQAICHDCSVILHAMFINVNTQKIIDTLSDQVVSTLEFWYTLHCFHQSNTSGGPTQQTTNSAVYVTDKAKCDLTNLITSVIFSEHPVYKLMHKRAIDFLRTALSSRPPEPLPLPPGFSILLDLDKPLDSSNANHSSSGHSKTAELISNKSTGSPNSIPIGMKSGGLLQNLSRDRSKSESDKNQTQSKILSLSALAGRLLPLFAHNRHVFGPQYAEIIQSLLIPKGGEQKRNTSGSV